MDYCTGDLKTWDAYNVAWVAGSPKGTSTTSTLSSRCVQRPLGYKGSTKTSSRSKTDASERMAVSQNAQWFEDNAPIMDAHKKKSVTGITYKSSRSRRVRRRPRPPHRRQPAQRQLDTGAVRLKSVSPATSSTLTPRLNGHLQEFSPRRRGNQPARAIRRAGRQMHRPARGGDR